MELSSLVNKTIKNIEVIEVSKYIPDDNIKITFTDNTIIYFNFEEGVNNYEIIPNMKINMLVTIIKGRFKDCKGRVVDIDKIDKIRPLVIRLSDTKDYNNCTIFVHYDDVVEDTYI